MNSIRKALAIPLATSGMMLYERGAYSRSLARLKKAFKWAPEELKGSVYEGYLGLALEKIENFEEAKCHLLSAQTGMVNSIKENPEDAEMLFSAISEIEDVLREGDT